MKFYRYLLYCLGIMIIIPSIASGLNKSLVFKQEKLVETKPWTYPYYFPLRLNNNNYSFTNNPIGDLPYPANSLNIPRQQIAPFVDYFWALNTGKLVFFNRHNNIVFVLDLKKKGWKEYYPRIDTNSYILNLWVGPDDAIYICDQDYNRYYKNLRYPYLIRKYFLESSKPGPTLNFRPIKFTGYPINMIVTPTDNHIITEMDDMGRTNFERPIFNTRGILLGHTKAEGNTCNGIRFNFQDDVPIESNAFSILSFDKDNLLRSRLREISSGRYHFKATFDNLIIIYGHRNKSLTPIGQPTAAIDLPFLIIFDPVSEQISEIDLSENINTHYIYYSISDISINYKGDIYALFVFYNKPGIITGDEKIVLYRWRRG
jgi:hypothetical protein